MNCYFLQFFKINFQLIQVWTLIKINPSFVLLAQHIFMCQALNPIGTLIHAQIWSKKQSRSINNKFKYLGFTLPKNRRRVIEINNWSIMEVIRLGQIRTCIKYSNSVLQDRHTTTTEVIYKTMYAW